MKLKFEIAEIVYFQMYGEPRGMDLFLDGTGICVLSTSIRHLEIAQRHLITTERKRLA